AEAQPSRGTARVGPAPAATVSRRAVSLPSLPHLRRDLLLSAALGLGLTLVVVMVGVVTG
ncbi:MAG: hypothetical protein OXI70_08925, partial [Chloroflexota bacterium]|nr:hypothetical protein [Chloroflexota bacterium]